MLWLVAHHHTTRCGLAAMRLTTTLIRRTAVVRSIVSLFAHPAAAQNAQVSLADATP
jgi:hypothetical protein